MIDLYYWPTSNGKKISIMLEECGLPYKVIPVNIGAGEQFEEHFLEISPNNRIPAIVDHDPPGGGGPISIFESGAILQYLAEKTGKFWLQDLRGKYEVTQWLMWRMGGLGPMAGQANHFRNSMPGQSDYAVKRYTDECNRLYGVMNRRLADRQFLAGDFSIADIACYGWVQGHERQGQTLEEFPNVRRWFEDMGARPGVARGAAVGKALRKSPDQETPEERELRIKAMYGQRAR